jgi:hypothetical protein
VVVLRISLRNDTKVPVRLDTESFRLVLDDGRSLAAHRGWSDYFNGCVDGDPCDRFLINPGFSGLVTYAVPLPAAKYHFTVVATDGSFQTDLGEYPQDS